jgi:hypothetical protein
MAQKPFGRSELSIVDVTGRLVMNTEIQLNNYFSIDLFGYKPGVYVLKISNDSGNSETKIVVN